MKLKPIVIVALSICLALGGIFGAMGLGLWSSSSEKTPARFQGGEFDGEYRADDIRGSYSFADISTFYNIPLEHLATAYGVAPDAAAGFKCKDLETIYGESEVEIGTGSVKLFVACYLGQPYALEEGDSFVTTAGANIIKEFGNPTQEQLIYVESHTADVQPNQNAEIASRTGAGGGGGDGQGQGQGQPGNANPTNQAIEVKGSEYLGDVADKYNIPLADLAKAFTLSESEARSMQVKDFNAKFQNADVAINTGSIKVFIAFYNNLPYDISAAESYIPAAGVEILKARATLTAEQEAYLDAHTWKG